MKMQRFLAGSFVLVAIFIFALNTAAQKAKPKTAASVAKPIIFAVLSDGTTLEPIAYVNKGKLEQPVSGGDDIKQITAFNRTYYKTGTSYRLIFGSAVSGSVGVKRSDPKSDCFKNMA